MNDIMVYYGQDGFIIKYILSDWWRDLPREAAVHWATMKPIVLRYIM